MDRIKTHCENNIGTICLDHPEKRNALSDELVAQIMTALGKLADERCRVVILQASPGTKVFPLDTTLLNCPRAAAIRSAGTIHSAISSAPSNSIPPP